MTLRIPETFSTCLVNWCLVAIICKTMPPRDPNDDDDEDEEEEEEDEGRDDEPAVVREPDEDE
jgi:hypothetical protein